ncbi:hypothetical protein DYB26_006637 [Aphanomyces astaci]|uniref:C2H2-type domain-containing protein n=1 Tax=Aphanomyces astaci TaxID=112090 RepID=A0A418FM03_APHAT|nr:hypothetical protein DYB26_006637 [Aphanomyces astaci]
MDDSTSSSMEMAQQKQPRMMQLQPATTLFDYPARARTSSSKGMPPSSSTIGHTFEDDEQDILRQLLGMESMTPSASMQGFHLLRNVATATQQHASTSRPYLDFYEASRGLGAVPRWSDEEEKYPVEAAPVGLTKAVAAASTLLNPVKKPHECAICHKRFRAKSELITHERIHTGHKPFKCMYEGCTKRFAHSSNLGTIMHQRLRRRCISMMSLGAHHKAHQGIKPYVCMHEGCGKRYAHSGSLKEHVWKHYGVKPFKCSHSDCDRTFTQRSNYSRHMKKCHGLDNKDGGGGGGTRMAASCAGSLSEIKNELSYM